jgi:hypothetical protein
VLALCIMLAGAVESPAGATTTASLHTPHVGATNPGFQEGTCPEPPGEATWGWHFVLPGSSTEFVSIAATFEHAGTVTAFVSHPTAKHAYVYTPGPDTLLGATATVDGPATTFNLSHVCPGVQEPPPPETGALRVTKQLAGATDGYVAGSLFTMQLDCEGEAFDGVFNLAAGASLTFDGLPVGIECRVEESALPDPAPGFEYGAPSYDPEGGVISITGEDATVVITVTNPLSSVSPVTTTPPTTTPPTTTPPTTTSPSTTAPPQTSPTTAGPQVAGVVVTAEGAARTGTLPVTGGPIRELVVLGISLVAAGALLLAARSRRAL